ncbi:HdeD family acid-resistance protein [Neorhizobium alkalisoli]|jgi:uncharacterized membrane protein HdeD (DUF308 family)|uniref:Uncharacterized membrane protein HdeD (DUF308 family) n=1 Tax=Neorhizobium alkalisoli TaxID=528178 RepID=A0A561R8C5_9HYPH|nr:HdeD family acid-resistance protein [Neorhizobium alkalisoli]TWF58853.1 uncharacterized membrane protein HdeD (DUF308 family) [Neorhizobium alkalisoli]
MTTITANSSLGSALKTARANWGWYVALGIALIIVGLLASINLFATTIASVIYIAAMMLVGAAFQIAHAFVARNWRRRTFDIISGLFYGAASAVLIFDPILSAVDIALVIGALLVAAGIFRIAMAIRDRSKTGWGWVLASGIATIVVGLLILLTWPSVGLGLLGAMLTIDLLFQGFGFLAFGLALRRRAS